MRRTIYVSNVGQTADLSSLQDLFTLVGDVTSKHLELIPESGHQASFGVFEMSTEQQASDCLERFNGSEHNGRRLIMITERPKPRPQIIKSKKTSLNYSHQ